MPTTSISYGTLPTPIPVSTTTTYLINSTLPAGATITDLNVDIAMDAPDEGGGPDPTLLDFAMRAYLSGGEVASAYLHFGPEDVSLVNYDLTRVPISANMDDFNMSSDAVDSWDIQVGNFSGTAAGTLNDFTINITYTVPPTPEMSPLFASGPNVRTLNNYKYGYSNRFGKRKNVKSTLVKDGVATTSLLSPIVTVPYHSRIEGIRYSVVNSGSGSETRLSLKKYSSGVVSTLVNSDIIIPVGLSYGTKMYGGQDYAKEVNAGDVLFFSVDQVATGISDLTIDIILAERE